MSEPKLAKKPQPPKKTYIDEEADEERIAHYKQPETGNGNALAGIDYARLTGTNFKKYFEAVEGDKIPKGAHKSHSMPARQGGMNRQKKYIFDVFRCYPNKELKPEKGEGFMEITGIELKSTIPTNVNVMMTLENATILNAQIGAYTSTYPGNIYLLDQTQEL